MEMYGSRARIGAQPLSLPQKEPPAMGFVMPRRPCGVGRQALDRAGLRRFGSLRGVAEPIGTEMREAG
jgi:hypothetical protein